MTPSPKTHTATIQVTPAKETPMTDPRIHRDEHGARIVLANSLEYLKTLPDNSVDSVVTDPPYEIGFMGRGWDNTGIAYSVELWKECLRVLKPGGHALVFGATRTYHRVAVAIEDAGFEIRDSIHWMYGSGFPKSMAIDKAIDKAAGAERETWEEPRRGGGVSKGQALEGGFTSKPGITIASAPATDEAKAWSGWGTALKPAHEPIVVARKPVEGTVAQNVLTYGVGGLNIDASRVGYEDTPNPMSNPLYRAQNNYKVPEPGQDSEGDVAFRSSLNPVNPAGRFPANILLTHSAECEQVGERSVQSSNGTRGAGGSTYANGKGFANTLSEVGQSVGYAGSDGTETIAAYRCVQGCPVAALDEQSGTLKSGELKAGVVMGKSKGNSFGLAHGTTYEPREADAGGASRFFTNTEHDLIDEADPFYYSAKAPKKERPVHPETGKGHPTVKPLEVMRWLIKLVTPAGGTVLEPFAGSGATVEAALLDGFKVIAIDITPEHMPLIDVRVDRVVDGTSPGLKVKPKKKAQSAPQKPSTGPLTALDAAQVAMEALARKKAPTALTLFEETDNA